MDSLDNVFSSECFYATRSTEKMNTASRKELPDSAFGLPKERKFPLYDAKGNADKGHIKSAFAYFRKCPEAKKKELAKAILKAIKSYNSKNEIKIKYSEDDAWFKYTK